MTELVELRERLHSLKGAQPAAYRPGDLVSVDFVRVTLDDHVSDLRRLGRS